MNKKQKKALYRILSAFIITVIVVFLKNDDKIKPILFLLPYFIAGYDILFDALRGIINKQPFDEKFLMAIATVGAFILGEYSEAVLVMVFYQLGELFQSYAVGKSRKNITGLLDLRPDYANVMKDGELIKTDPYEISVGDCIYVKPGEKIAFDGVIVEGKSTLDTVALTGESVPASVYEGDSVLSGSVNLSGLIKIKVEKEFDDSTASKILDLVENATANKSRSEKFITKFARIYTPAVCLFALCIAVLPPALLWTLKGEILFGEWIYRALTFLVISCPCALVVSVPLSFFAGIGGAGKNGILIKGANYLETLSKVRYVVFDKTGTLTEGVFDVTGVYPENITKEQLIEYASYAEFYSTHPIRDSLVKSYSKVLDKSRISCFTEISGHGVSAKIDEKLVLVGNAQLMKNCNISFSEYEGIGTVVYVAVDGVYMGCVVISDKIKSDAKATVKSLKQNGIKKTFMLTGDRKNIGEYIGNEIGIDEVKAQLLPVDKVEHVESLIKMNDKNGRVAFVGDGINDAPVLARADVGVAMGALGSDAAIEAADVILMDDKPSKLVSAIKISKKCMSIVYQNIYFSIGIKLLVLALGLFGIADMWFAIFADVGVMVLAVLNSIRAMKL